MEAIIKGMPILSIIQGLSKFHGKKYCYPSQKKVLELLKNRLGIRISIATLNRYLRVIEDKGLLRRIRRLKRDHVKGMIFQSTIYIITYKGYTLLQNMGAMVWKFIQRVSKKKDAVRKEPYPIKFNGVKRKFVYNKNPV